MLIEVEFPGADLSLFSVDSVGLFAAMLNKENKGSVTESNHLTV